MKDLAELVREEKAELMEQSSVRIKNATHAMDWAAHLDFEHVEEFVNEAILELSIPADLEPTLYMMADRMDVDFSMMGAKYEDIIQHDEATLSWNGNWITVNKSHECKDIRVSIKMEAKIPEDVAALLRACGKIEDIESSQQTAMC